MLVLPDNIRILPKSDVKSDVGLRWQGWQDVANGRCRTGVAVTSPP